VTPPGNGPSPGVLPPTNTFHVGDVLLDASNTPYVIVSAQLTGHTHTHWDNIFGWVTDVDTFGQPIYYSDWYYGYFRPPIVNGKFEYVPSDPFRGEKNYAYEPDLIAAGCYVWSHFG
jgi:hypothetical protein